MKVPRSLAALLLLLCLAPVLLAQTVAARVVRVIDGDTIVVAFADRTIAHIRLAEIDAPEHDQPWGLEATAFTTAHVAHQAVSVAIQGTDRYGRLIAHISIDGWDLNTELVRAGLAWWYILDRVQSRLALLSAQGFELRHGSRLPEVLPEDSNIDVFRKSRNQSIGFRERSSALEEEPRMASGQAVEKNIKRPGDPKIFFDVLFRRAESSRGGKKDIAAVLRRRFEELRQTRIHHARLGERSVAAGIVVLADAEGFLRAVA